MKKIYIKPIVIVENFSLSTHIAADCGTITDIPSREVHGCGYKLEKFNKVVFTSEMGCTYTEDDGDHNGICYHTPVESSSLFNS